MATYTVQDQQTGKNITFEWYGDTPPTDSDMAEVSASASSPSPQEKPQVANEEGALSKFASNIVPSALNTAKNMAYPFVHPFETAKNIGNLAIGTAQLAIPGEQGKEGIPRAVGQFFADRYGGVDNIKKTVTEDPIGALTDVASIASLGGGALSKLGKISGISKLANTGAKLSDFSKAIDPISRTVSAGATVGSYIPGVKTLGEFTANLTPESLYAGAMKFSNNPSVLSPKDRRAAIEAGLLGEYLPDNASYDRLWNTVNKNKSDVNSIIQTGSRAGDTVDTATAMRFLGPLKQRAALVANQYPEFMDELTNIEAKYAGSPTIPVAQAQALKETLQDLSSYGTDDRSKFVNRANKAIGRGLRIALEEQYPDLAKLNKENSALLTLENELAKAAGRVGNRDLMNLGVKVALGGIGEGATAAQKGNVLFGLVDIPSVKSRLAIALNKANGGNSTASALKKALSSNNTRLSAFQVGRMESGDNAPISSLEYLMSLGGR